MGRWVTPRGKGARLPGSALGGTQLLSWEPREPGLPHRRPRNAAANLAVRAAGGDAPAAPARRRAGGLRPGGPHRRARGRRALPARRAAGAPPAASRTPRQRPLPLRSAPARAGPRRGEAPAHLERRRRGGGESPRGGDGARQPPPERPCRGLCLRCHMGRGAGFKRVSAGHAVSGAPQPCPQRQRSARPGMRL